MSTPPPAEPAESAAAPADLQLEVDFAGQRRWTVLLRLILAIPQAIVLGLVSIAAGVVTVIGWFAALVTGRLPGWVSEFLSDYLAWTIRLAGYMWLLTDRYPPFAFTAPGYPVRIALPPPGRLNRAAVLFRLILLIPAYVVNTLISGGWSLLSIIFWLIVLITGRMPPTLFLATAAAQRYSLRYLAYFLMLTSAYPKKLFGDAPSADQLDPAGPATRPLVLTKGARTLLIVFIVVGALAYIGQASAQLNQPHQSKTTIAGHSIQSHHG
jgi:hypothetical protein